MKKKAYSSSNTGTSILYDTTTGGLVRTNDDNRSGLWVRDERVGPRINIAWGELVPDLCPSLNPQFAIIAITNYSDYERNNSHIKTHKDEESGTLLRYYTKPTAVIYELDFIRLSQYGITNELTEREPLISGSNFISNDLNQILFDEFRPADNYYLKDGEKVVSSTQAAFDYDPLDFEQLYPYTNVINSSHQLYNRREIYGAPIFSENGTNYLSASIYRDIAVCDYFLGNWTAEHIGLGKLIVNIYFSLIGESLRGYSVGSNLFWPPLTTSRLSSGELANSPLSSINYNAAGINYVGDFYEFNDNSSLQFVGSEFSIFNNSRRNDQMLQFRWNFWNQGAGDERYPNHESAALPALDKSSELRNFPDFPRQTNYNVPGAWVPSNVNSSSGGGSYPDFFINTDHISFEKPNEVQKLKVFAARTCTINIRLQSEVLISNYAASSVRIFSSETFFNWSSSNSINMSAGETREITISILPLIRNPTATLKSNRYNGSYILGTGDLESEDGQILYLDLTYTPKYILNTCRASEIVTNGLHRRRVYCNNFNYIISEQNCEVLLKMKTENSLENIVVDVAVEKIVGNAELTFSSQITFEKTSELQRLSLKGTLTEDQIAFITLSLSYSLQGKNYKKLLNFQILPVIPQIAQDFIQVSQSININNNNIYIYFEHSDTEEVTAVFEGEEAMDITIEFEEGFDNFFSYEFSNSLLTLTRKDGFANKDFFVKGIVNNTTYFFVTNFYPTHGNFKPLLVTQI